MKVEDARLGASVGERMETRDEGDIICLEAFQVDVGTEIEIEILLRKPVRASLSYSLSMEADQPLCLDHDTILAHLEALAVCIEYGRLNIKTIRDSNENHLSPSLSTSSLSPVEVQQMWLPVLDVQPIRRV